ncbi:hypothetical protein AGDE_14242 [Angomonas deanei]|uniref:Uncharacterized protein n=1 Tax=Angomonas deanei TaxID=59799 RepID=A0A7G2C3C7_9TRYP|nr:hypothetical protein AGDE_14242 [Angomonas deanei]CAD2214298.1 hypothetical protein, conserved [Angomonas deanei]|eukprot:EPY21181.1 hypothetical protein AGDE_14242 [Angomonas deanei]
MEYNDASHASAGSSPVTVGELGVEYELAMQAYVCIDPRLSEQGQLYNLSAVISGRARDSRLVVYEGTLVCDTTTIIEAMCALSPLNSVLLPLLFLTENVDSLPFSVKGFPYNKANCIVQENKEDAVKDLLSIVFSLLEIPFVRKKMKDVGLFPLFALMLQKVGIFLTPDVVELLLELCAAVASDEPLFESVFMAFFLCPEFVHSLTHETRAAAVVGCAI